MLVSIIMPAYNCGRFIEESIQSVLAQTATDWELLIVDDNSADHTEAILKPYLAQYPNIRYTRFPENRGAAAARNEAIRQACGRYIAFLDSDDLWTPDKLEKQIAFMQAQGATFCATGYAKMDEKGRSLHKAMFPPAEMDYRTCLRLSDPIGNLTVMYDQSVWGKFQVPDIKKRNDYALWLRMLRTIPCCVGFPEVLATYRVRESSISSRKLRLAKYHWQLYYEIEQLGLVKSIWYLLCWAWVKGTGIGLEKRSV